MNTGNKGKFSERIKKIANSKRKNNFNTEKEKGAVRRFLLIPLMFLDKKIHRDKKEIIKETNDVSKVSFNDKKISKKELRAINVLKRNKINIQQKGKIEGYSKAYSEKKNDTVNSTFMYTPFSSEKSQQGSRDYVSSENKDIVTDRKSNESDLLKKRVDNDYEGRNIGNSVSVNIDDSKKVNDFDVLTSKITSEISKYLVKNINKLEMIESDLYVLSRFDGNAESLEKCKEYIIKLKALQNKLIKIRRDFNILKENIDFDNILEISDNTLLDKLIEFRNSVNNDISLSTAKNYKLLDEYKYLYAKIDKIVQDTDKLEVEIVNRKDDLEQAGINFNDFQKKVYSFDKVEKTTDKMFQKQDKILADLESKVSDVSVTKKIEKKYKGFGSLFFNSMKLFALYMLSPFENSLPGIAVATVATKKTVDNLLKAVHIEEKTKYMYQAHDYRILLNASLNELSELDRMLTSSLSDIRTLRSEFINKFSSYADQLPKYNTMLKKINQMEKQMINNQVKVRTFSDRVVKKRRENENTLAKVKKLNNS